MVTQELDCKSCKQTMVLRQWIVNSRWEGSYLFHLVYFCPNCHGVVPTGFSQSFPYENILALQIKPNPEILKVPLSSFLEKVKFARPSA